MVQTYNMNLHSERIKKNVCNRTKIGLVIGIAVLLLLTVVLLLLTIDRHTDDDKKEHVVIDTPSGSIKGIKRENSQTGKTVYEFRGIQYGKPPVGQLRFRKPEPAGIWKETLDATMFGAVCPQYIPKIAQDVATSKMSENCLYLNVYVPKEMIPKKKLSVMVWIHGGGLAFGFAHQYDGGWIATEGDVIVVTINYRLNIFGFLALNHPAAKGNYGLWDQKLALEWVHNNIAAFGGNPESVTIFGQSGGAWSTSFQSLIPSNKGLFQRVIAQSGVVGRIRLLQKKTMNEQINNLAKKTSCPPDDMFKFADCLREKSMDELVNATDFISRMPNDKLIWTTEYNPVVDGELYPAHPISLLEDTKSVETTFFKSLDFLAGTTSNEGNILYLGILPDVQEHFGFKVMEGIPTKFLCQGMVAPFVEQWRNDSADVKQKLCDFYSTNSSLAEQSMRASDFFADVMFSLSIVEMLEFHSNPDTKTYQYLFSKETEQPLMGPPPPWCKGTGHGEDLPYLFDMNKSFPTPSGPRVLNADERKFASRFIQYFVSFAKTGIPDGGDGSGPWKQFDIVERNYLDLDVKDTIKSNWKQKTVEFWSKLN